MSVPITIVSGFLGAGKTTLVNRLLTEAPQRLAVLVNDFAAINIDAELIAAVEPGRIALTNGCVCCTLRDDLVVAALQLAAAEPPPERIVIETSGVADPYGVMEAFLAPEIAGRVFVESTVCVVDAEQFPALDFASGELAIDQAAVSDIVLLNKCDLVSDDHAAEVEATLLGALPAMRIQRTTNARLAWAVMLGLGAEDAKSTIGRASHAHRHDDAYASWAWTSARPLDLAAFRRIVAELPRGVLRAKGVLHFSDAAGERGVFQLVGKRSSLTFEVDASGDQESRLVAIGASEGFPAAALASLFASVASTMAA